MSKINGKLFRLFIGASGSETALPLEVTSNFGIENALLDASDKDSGGYASRVDGQRDWNISATVNYDPNQSEVMDLIDSIVDPATSTEKDILIGMNTTAGDIAWRGKALLESINFTEGNNELMTLDVTLQCNSPLTKVTKA